MCSARGTCLKTFYAGCRALGTVEILSRGNIGKGKRTHALYEELTQTRSNGPFEASQKKKKKKKRRREKEWHNVADVVLQMPRNAFDFPLSTISEINPTLHFNRQSSRIIRRSWRGLEGEIDRWLYHRVPNSNNKNQFNEFSLFRFVIFVLINCFVINTKLIPRSLSINTVLIAFETASLSQ